jgi:hypothetical protein
MRKILSLTFAVLLIFISCKKEERTAPKPNFDASDGYTVGVIRLTFTDTPEGDEIAVERREKGTQEWKYIASCGNTFYDDNSGYSQDDEMHGMPPGKVFEYRARNSRYEYGDLPEKSGAEYSEIQEGFAYNIIPITDINIEKGTTSNSLTWNAGNNGTFMNESEIYFDVYRSADSLGTYEKIGRVDEDRSYIDDFYTKPELQGKDFYYRVDVYYNYMIIMHTGGYHDEVTSPVEGAIAGAHINSNENPTINYTITDLGQAASSSPGFIQSLKTKVIDNVVYFGAITDASANSIGKPALYQLNGSSWQELWTTLPFPEIGFTRTSFAVNSGKSYMAGIDDSLCVYEWNGTDWSANLTPDNLGASDRPGWVSIELFNDELYMAIEQAPDYNLQVLKWDGSSAWDTIGGDADGIIASGSIFETQIENIDGTLYLHYQQGDILNIKHLDGTSWTTDLEWTQEWLTAIQLDKNGSELYFSSNTRSTTFDGGVYYVTSTSSVENLIPEDAEWFQLGVFSFTIDSEGNVIVSSMKAESAEVHYPYINIFDGTEWKTISDDFSDGTEPTGLESIGTDIYYIYGDEASEGQWVDPTILKSKKYTK